MTTQVPQRAATIADGLTALARRHPGRLALAIARERGRSGARYEEVSLAELEHDAGLFAGMFAHRGIVKGMRTVVMINPGRAFCAAVFGLLKLGATLVFIDPGIGLRNAGHCMRQAEPAAFVGTWKAHIARRVFGWGRDSVRIALTVDPDAIVEPAPAHVFHEGLATRSHSVETTTESLAVIAFTSGSTGPPKGVVFEHKNLSAQAELVGELLGSYAGEPHLATFPLFLLFAPVLGLTAVLPRMDMSKPKTADPARLASAIDAYRCRSAFMSPVLVRKLGAYCREAGRRLSSMERVLSAGAPASTGALATLADALPANGEIFTPYGATEALPVSNLSSREIFAETNEKTRHGAGVCVGRPLSGLTASIIPITNDSFADWSEVPRLLPGEIGEITVSGGVVSRSYFNNPAANRHSKILCKATGALYHRMADLGYIDERGRLWMCGRKSQRVVTSTRVYFTVPCEGIFNTHPDVERTALVGVTGRDGAVPVLCVELARAASRKTRDRITRDLRVLGARYDLTRPVDHFLYHRSFPVDARHNSKIRREDLAAWAAKKLGPRV